MPIDPPHLGLASWPSAEPTATEQGVAPIPLLRTGFSPQLPHARHWAGWAPPASNPPLPLGQSRSCRPALLPGGRDREPPQGNPGKEKHILPHPVNSNTRRTADPSLGRDPAHRPCCPLANASACGAGAITFFYFPLPHSPSAGRLFQCGSL